MIDALAALVTAAARATPEAVAVCDGPRCLTYAELAGRSQAVAHRLVAAGVGRGDRVGLYLEKSIEAVVGLYAVLSAGAAYVPLDPSAPARRLAAIAADCAMDCIVTAEPKGGGSRPLPAAAVGVANAVVLGAGGVESTNVEGAAANGEPGVPAAGAELDPLPCVAADDLAYILYTSGSTGVPKGVMLTHGNALAFVRWAVRTFELSAADRVSGHAPFHFDLSVFDLFASAAAGATLVLVPPATSVFPVELVRFIERTGITVWYSVPSVLTLMSEHGNLRPGDLAELRAILFAGEVLPVKHLRRLMGALPGARFSNLYGPTETNVCTWYDVEGPPAADAGPVPIGRAIEGVEVFAVSADGRRCAPGEVGELHVSGPTVMRGYWGDPERSRRSLVPQPGGALAYRTGDLGRIGADGNWLFLGRGDEQVKVRGHRIELGEVEAALGAHPAVWECAVVAVPDELVSNRLAAWVVVDDPSVVAALHGWCGERVPRSMIPEVITVRHRLPRTSTGKVDRRTLVAEATPLMADRQR